MQPGEYEELLCENWQVQAKGLFWRLFKLYWKKVSFVLLMLFLPGGLWVLSLCAAVWALNWEKEMTAYFDEKYRRWKEDHGIHS